MTDNVVKLHRPQKGGSDGEGLGDEFAEAVLDEIAEMAPELEEFSGTGEYWRIVQARNAGSISELVEVRDELFTALCAAQQRHWWVVAARFAVLGAVCIGVLVGLYYLAAHLIGVASTWDWAAAWQFVAHYASMALQFIVHVGTAMLSR